jgi:hypothetical protein
MNHSRLKYKEKLIKNVSQFLPPPPPPPAGFVRNLFGRLRNGTRRLVDGARHVAGTVGITRGDVLPTTRPVLRTVPAFVYRLNVRQKIKILERKFYSEIN